MFENYFSSSFKIRSAVKNNLYKLSVLFDYARLHPLRELERMALAETVSYIQENMPSAVGFPTEYQLLNYALKEANFDGHFLEFGVFQGSAIKYIAKKCKTKIIEGFDSFEGLPESWSGYNATKGHFSVQGKLPQVPKNVVLHKGWFEESLPKWVEKNSGYISFLHIDCDLYSSTKTVFDYLAPQITTGTIILFDEYFNYQNWRRHEYKAFQEFIEKTNCKYEYLGYAKYQVLVKML